MSAAADTELACVLGLYWGGCLPILGAMVAGQFDRGKVFDGSSSFVRVCLGLDILTATGGPSCRCTLMSW